MTTAGDESLLEAALRTGIDAPYWCIGGACGTDLAEQHAPTAPHRRQNSHSIARSPNGGAKRPTPRDFPGGPGGFVVFRGGGIPGLPRGGPFLHERGITSCP